LSVPAGFTADGLPIGVEFLGRAYADKELLRLGLALERTAVIRRPPPSTPQAVGSLRQDGGPSPALSGPTPAISARFAWKDGDGRLTYEVQANNVRPSDVLLVALHRAPAPDQTGPAIARLVRPGEVSGRGEIPLRPADREDLKAGRLYVQLFTRAAPFGAARVPVTVDVRRP
jgi:hypothetical protein